jgi:hypothetical protein
MELLLITGPAGVGQSTLCWEMSAQLAAADVHHAVIETDELDRVYPRPLSGPFDRARALSASERQRCAAAVPAH